MKQILFFIFVISLNLNAQNMAEILGSLKESNKTKSMLKTSESQIVKNEFFTTQEAPNLGVTFANAKENANNGAEYSVGISQNLSHPFTIASKERGVNEFSKAIKQETIHELHLLKLDVVSKYHNSCVSKEMRDKATFLLDEQSKRFSQIQKAYEVGEISKKELLFNKLDLAKLRQNVNNYKRN